MIRQHKLRGHNFVHIGLVQVGIQPLTREGLDSSVLLQLRDARHKNMNNSILGIVESSLANGPIHFDCYPNLKISLHDPHILKILTLGIQTSGAINDMLEGSHTLALIYRIYYKCSKTNLNEQSLIKSPKGSTILIQTSTKDANIKTPKSIQWKNVNLPQTWLVENENYSQPQV